ncbi:MAG: ATPase [Bryobacterales bacterium]|nr:ATPase [Bryobacterales bacterium]
MAAYFLGVDGGQSSTTSMIGDETGRVAGVGLSGPCNHVGAAEGRAKFTGAILGSVQAACAQAGLNAATIHFSSACLGFSGGPADKEPLLNELLRCERMIVTDDALIALAGATAGEPGVIVISGTGSIGFGRNSLGRTARAGGWGYLFGDEGGGFWIARQALRAALRFEEGWGAPTSLRARLLDETGARNMNDLLHRCYTTGFPRPRIASFSVLVNHAAESGDPAASRILDEAARELALLAGAVRRQLFGTGDSLFVSYAGGAFNSRILRGRFRNLIQAQMGARVAAPVYEPAAGALLEAYRAAGFSIPARGLI